MSKTLLIIAHSETPPIHKMHDILESLGWGCNVVRTPFGEELPPVESVPGLIIMGSAAAVYRRDKLAWVDTEMTWVEEALKREIPTFGICFGCQMLAQLMGGEVIKGEHGREFGFTKVYKGPACGTHEIFGTGLEGQEVFQAHGDTFTLPETARCLLTGELYPHQAIQYADHVFGTQFHPEISPEVVERWHQYALDRDETLGDHVPPTPAAHKALARKKNKPVDAWLEGFLARLFKSAY
jgi:GMP synthase-like glutamine amidotransferase